MTNEESAQLDNWFTYHSPAGDQIARYAAIREAAIAFAVVVVENCVSSADRTSALRKIREATMTANASIACGGK